MSDKSTPGSRIIPLPCPHHECVCDERFQAVAASNILCEVPVTTLLPMSSVLGRHEQPGIYLFGGSVL